MLSLPLRCTLSFCFVICPCLDIYKIPPLPNPPSSYIPNCNSKVSVFVQQSTSQQPQNCANHTTPHLGPQLYAPGSLLRRPCSQSQPHSGPARPRPLPTARGRPARRSRSYKSRLRGRGPGHSQQLCRGDCTARPAGPAPTGVRRLQQPQHRDLGPRAGHGCALGLSAQVGAPGAPRRARGTGRRERVRDVG